MDDGVGAVDCVGECIGIEDRPFDEPDRDAVEIRSRTGRQVVEPNDLVTQQGESLAHV